jgi:hypothetical protein
MDHKGEAEKKKTLKKQEIPISKEKKPRRGEVGVYIWSTLGSLSAHERESSYFKRET